MKTQEEIKEILREQFNVPEGEIEKLKIYPQTGAVCGRHDSGNIGDPAIRLNARWYARGLDREVINSALKHGGDAERALRWAQKNTMPDFSRPASLPAWSGRVLADIEGTTLDVRRENEPISPQGFLGETVVPMPGDKYIQGSGYSGRENMLATGRRFEDFWPDLRLAYVGGCENDIYMVVNK